MQGIESIKNDPLTIAIMDANAARRASYSRAPIVLIDVQNEKWAQQMEDARWLDAYAVAHHGQPDHCFHFCSMQRQQHAEGFLLVEIATNVYGFVVRDTMNDGMGVLFGGCRRPGTTQAEALEWAREWHAERPTHRKVIAGCGYVLDSENV